MTKYIGLTIGPIVKTISNAKRTGELWGASYIFSYIMKSIIKKIYDKYKESMEFVVPYIDEEVFKQKLGVGLFHDRFILRINEGSNVKIDLEKISNEVIAYIGNKIIRESNIGDKEQVKLQEYFKKYFQMYYVEKEIKNEENPIIVINKCLDLLELKQQYIPKEERNYLQEYMTNKKVKKSFLMDDALKSKEKFKRFLSVTEIAAMELKNRYEINEEDENKFFKKLRERTKEIPKAYKYYALVQADGDNIGKIIKNLDFSKEEYKDFSKKLFEFAKTASERIKKHEGFTIYAGGDDLLFLYPLINKTNKNGIENEHPTVFDMMHEISELFRIEFKDYIDKMEEKKEKKPSLSFGVTIAYYKYPLYEVLENARNLLFKEAKNYKLSKEKEKNAIAVRLIKHSGQSFQILLNKDEKSESYKLFKELFKQTIENKKEREKNIIASIPYRLIKDEYIVLTILKDQEHYKEMLENYFENNVRNNINKEDEHVKRYVEDVKRLIIQAVEEIDMQFLVKEKELKEEEILKSILENIYACLKFLQFMNEKVVL